MGSGGDVAVDVGSAREVAESVRAVAAALPAARTAAPPPATGAWREGDPAGRRRFADVGDLPLQLGGVLPRVRLAYETWG